MRIHQSQKSNDVDQLADSKNVKSTRSRLDAMQMPLWMQSNPVQTKLLQVNSPGDAYEREADAIANQVMRQPASSVQRRCACGGIAGADGECAACKAKRLQREVVSSSAPSSVASGSEAPASVHQTLAQPGQALDTATRHFMESRFGQDFSHVRVHTDSQAAQSATDVNAQAYTVGNNIVFGAGQYQPMSDIGQQLIAHELVHTMQQSETVIRRETKQSRRSVCSSGVCPQGRASAVTRTWGQPAEPDNEELYIETIYYNPTGGNQAQVYSKWTDGHCEGPFPATLEDADLPPANDVVGTKCDVNHTNGNRDHMAFYLSFKSAAQYGFHNSQPVGAGYHSHGCVRMCCNNIQHINANTWTNVTTIVRGTPDCGASDSDSSSDTTWRRDMSGDTWHYYNTREEAETRRNSIDPEGTRTRIQSGEVGERTRYWVEIRND